jgi:hypothetical protein
MRRAIAADRSTGQPKDPRNPTSAADERTWARTSAGTTAMTSLIPRRSVTAREKMLAVSPARGMNSHARK